MSSFSPQLLSSRLTYRYLIYNVLTLPYQVFDGISTTDVDSESFIQAMVESVSDALGVPASAVTITIINGRRNKRALLASVSTTYTLDVDCGMTADMILEKLRESISQGSFLTSMQAKSGLPIISMSTTALTDTTPVRQKIYFAPTASPVSKKGKSQFLMCYCNCGI